MQEDDHRPRSIRDEAKTKNPIRTRLRLDRDVAPHDALVAMVATGRDAFHQVISRELRSRYKRPSIYLADGWLVRALGVFQHRGRVEEASLSSLELAMGLGEEERAASKGSLRPMVHLLQAYADFAELLDGVRLLDLHDERAALEDATFGLLDDPSSLDTLVRELGALTDLVQRAATVLSRDKALAGFGDQQGRRLRNLAGAFNCLSTNPVNNDWDRTLDALPSGVLVTGLT